MTDSERELRYPKARHVDQMLGKTITGIVIKEDVGDSLCSQVLLVFSDDTHFEFYSQSEIVPIKGIRHGGMDDVTGYSRDRILYEGRLQSSDKGE